MSRTSTVNFVPNLGTLPWFCKDGECIQHHVRVRCAVVDGRQMEKAIPSMETISWGSTIVGTSTGDQHFTWVPEDVTLWRQRS